MQARLLIAKIKRQYETYLEYDADQLRKEALDLGFESRTHGNIEALVERGFALVRAAAKRELGMVHYDVQLLGGLSMCRGNVAEMKTGEGKTLTATLPMFLRSLGGEGALLATSNDYLAMRDAMEMKPVYNLLGMSVGVIQSEMSREQRRESYKCDITYGTMKEFGFDFLRDHSARREQQQRDFYYGGSAGGVAQSPMAVSVHRRPHFILIDEADSILIDDARTPLIISSAGDDSSQEQETSLYQWSADSAPKFEEELHYWYDRERRKVDLTPDGTALVREIAKPRDLAGIGLLQMYDFVERAIQVHRDYKANREYVVRDGEIVIVDEATGRISEGRRWSRGIHQAIEAKEHVKVSVDTATNAKITVQSFVSRFPHMAGMTGTAFTSAKEFKKIYGMGVSVIPTNRKRIRKELPIKYFPTEELKLQEIAADVKELHEQGRPILIGTRSIAKSET
ncbi:MAG: DEAD/DEAH box helicase, partial [Planctomycetota bacterium]